MKSTSGWSKGFNGTNSSGFSGLPGGYRDSNRGNFRFDYSRYINSYDGPENDQAGWWSSSEGNYSAFGAEYGAIGFGMQASGNFIHMYAKKKGDGYSVRCLRD